MGVVEHKRLKNEACSRGPARVRTAAATTSSARIDAEAQDRRAAAPGRRRARADAVDEPDRDRLLQGAAGADDAKRGRRQPAPARPRGARADAARLLAERPSRAGAPDGCVQVVEEPTIPLIEALMADPTTDVIVATGGVGGRARRLPLRQPGASASARATSPRWSTHTADLAAAAELHRRLQGASTTRSCARTSRCAIVEERVRRRVRARARPPRRRTSARPTRWRARARRRSSPTGACGIELIGRDAAALAARGGHPRAAADARAGRAVPADRARGAARAREAVPAARPRARARRPPRHRRGPRDAAHRRRRPLGGDPLRAIRARSWPTAPPSTCCGSR